MKAIVVRNLLIFLSLVLAAAIFYSYYIAPIVRAQNYFVGNYQNESQNLGNNISGEISPIFTREVQYWGSSIKYWSANKGLDPNLAAVVMQIESCGDPRAVSEAGASGLFQVMPFHFGAGDNAFNPDTNADKGLGYLSKSLDTARSVGGNERLAFAGYNGGIGVITRGEHTWANQTHRYVKYAYPIYLDAISGATSSPALDEWYSKYGRSLCRQASRRLGISE